MNHGDFEDGIRLRGGNVDPDGGLPAYDGPVHRPRFEHPRLTLFRLLNIGLTAGFGSVKAYLSYRGFSTAPTTLDWLYGVVVFMFLYWLNLYHLYSSVRARWFFEESVFTSNVWIMAFRLLR